MHRLRREVTVCFPFARFVQRTYLSAPNSISFARFGRERGANPLAAPRALSSVMPVFIVSTTWGIACCGMAHSSIYPSNTKQRILAFKEPRYSVAHETVSTHRFLSWPIPPVSGSHKAIRPCRLHDKVHVSRHGPPSQSSAARDAVWSPR